MILTRVPTPESIAIDHFRMQSFASVPPPLLLSMLLILRWNATGSLDLEDRSLFVSGDGV